MVLAIQFSYQLSSGCVVMVVTIYIHEPHCEPWLVVSMAKKKNKALLNLLCIVDLISIIDFSIWDCLPPFRKFEYMRI